MQLKRQKTYKSVFDKACADLVNGPDIEEKIYRAGLRSETAGNVLKIFIPFFDDEITVSLPSCTFTSARGANITLVARIIILHYLNTASGIPLTGDKIAYGDIPASMHYDPVFERRVLKPLIRAFGYDKYSFIDAGKSLAAKDEEFGDAAFTFFAFPKVPITFIIWEGDEEFPPRAKTLFDPSITGYLPLEDIVVIAKLASGRILKQAMKNYSED